VTAYSELQALVSRDLADPDNLTFDSDAVKDFIQQGLAAVGRVAPEQFQEDLDPVSGQLAYPLRSTIFSDFVPEIRLVRVEVWTGLPLRFKFKIKSKASQPTRDSNAGWEVWNGTLEIPATAEPYIYALTDTIRVWGYSPYRPVVDDSDVVPLSAELELALRTFCTVEGLRRLTNSRVLFKQWQARSNNTDITVGQLNSDLQVAEERWRRLARELKVIEQNPD
jgi:hypothetical protein